MTRTKINGQWVDDNPKDLRQSTTATSDKLQRQHDALAEALRAIKQCKSITEVRKCIVHAQAVYPTK